LVGSLFLLVFLVEAALFAYVYTRQSGFMLHELEIIGDEYVVNLGEVLAVPLWDFDDEQIGKIGSNFVQDERVNELHITDGQGKSLFKYHSGKKIENGIKRSGDIVYKGQIIGHVSLFLSLDAYKQELALLRNVTLLMLAGSLIVIFIATGMLLRIFIRIPLRSLQKGIDRVAQGDYSYRFDDIHHIELSGIARRFREMASVVQSRERSLNQINEALEAEISIRKMIEDKIRDSEARSLALLDAIPDLIFQFDGNGKLLDYRGRKEDWFTTSEDFIGKTIGEISPPEISALFKENITRARETKTNQFFEYELPQADQTAYFECRIVAVSDDISLSIIRDITQNKKDAAEKSRLEEQLQQAQKMEAVGTLAGGVAHDLNNILSGIVSYPEMLLMDMHEDSPLRKSLLTIKESGEKAATVVQDLLTLARRGVTVTEVVNLNTILNQFLISPEFRKLKAYHPDIHIVTELENNLLNILGSPVHLSKMIMNLIANAAEAMPYKGKILVSTRNQYIDLPIRGYDDVAEGDYALFSVLDTGVGISHEDMDRIFEPFYTKKVMGRSGTGLGMAVVWGAIKDHKGYIDIHSTEGNGTTISLYIPATREELPERIEPISIMEYTGCGETILIVDDIKEQREIASNILSKLNYSVAAVESGEQAIDYMKVNTAELLVLDMIMDPGIDGFETYKRVLELHPGQKAVIASGFSETDRVRNAQALGAGIYIKKPYTMEKIGIAVKNELEKRDEMK